MNQAFVKVVVHASVGLHVVKTLKATTDMEVGKR